jgi:hypothetical protein
MKWLESDGPEPESAHQECGVHQMSPGRARGDAWLLPDDGIIDRIAVEIAARGERKVALTAPERRAAAELILAHGGTAQVIAERLCMTDRAASALAYVIRNGYTGPPIRQAA